MFLQIFIDFVKGISEIYLRMPARIFFFVSNAMSLSLLDVRLGEIMVGKCTEATNIMRATGHYQATQMSETYIALKGFRSLFESAG